VATTVRRARHPLDTLFVYRAHLQVARQGNRAGAAADVEPASSRPRPVEKEKESITSSDTFDFLFFASGALPPLPFYHVCTLSRDSADGSTRDHEEIPLRLSSHVALSSHNWWSYVLQKDVNMRR
jgi:hypothetical protein